MSATNSANEMHPDPQMQSIARTYADAFLNAAPAGQVEGLIDEFSSFVNDFLAKQPQFKSLLESAMVSRDEKLGLIDRTVAKVASPTLANFLGVVANHERLGMLAQILNETVKQHEIRTGRGRVQVISARALTAQATENIQRQLAQTLPFQPVIEARVDPSLLGGLIIRVGDTVYDGSLRTRLKQLRTRMQQRSIHEIQSGRDRFSHSERD